MNRARITALALVNWKGVFYERYLLDRHVTALEGANGAGKTTVMIAAYVVLLPDMSRLRFTNLGETGATGGDRGIWGRLGEAGRPSYAALDLELADGERLIAAVRLTRGAEPAVEPTTFVVTGLAAEARLQEIFLERREEQDLVPELDEIKESARRLGGKVEVFKTTKEYFAALFERGVMPLRLAADEERNKLNEMLRTSMTGGISRALTSELRSFLLKEESGLADTLSRMRANLEACRRTRTEVGEARNLEREISGVYDAGLAMFTAAVMAAREASEEAQRRVAQARATLEVSQRGQQELNDGLAALTSRQATMSDRLAAAQAGLERAQAERDRVIAAGKAAARLAELEAELAWLSGEANEARRRQAVASDERTARKLERERAQEAHDRAAYGLANLQDGLDELHRRAHAHRHLGRRLEEARGLLGEPGLAAADVASRLAIIGGRREALDAERARLDRDTRALGGRREDHARALRALAGLEAAAAAGLSGDADGSSPSAAEGAAAAAAAGAMMSGEADEIPPQARARAALARLAERESLLVRLPGIEREIAESQRLSERQRGARGRAAALGIAVGQVGATPEVENRLDAAELGLREAEEESRREEAAAEAAGRQVAEIRGRRGALEERAARWGVIAAAAARLAAALDQQVTSRDEVTALRDRLAEEQLGLTAARKALAAEREELLRQAAALEATGASIQPELLRLRDELGGELLAGRFEDLDPDEASWVEARLGPLTQAVIVEDLEAAARTLGARGRERPAALASVWLVPAGADLDLARPPRGDGDDAEEADDGDDAEDVVSREAFGLRVTRRSDRPTLGRRALERRVAELRDGAARLGGELDALVERLQRLAGARRDVEALYGDVETLAGGDPAAAIAAAEQELAELAAAERDHRRRAGSARERATGSRALVDELRRLLGEAFLLEPPDHAARHAELSDSRTIAVAARAELARVADDRRTLSELLDVLRVAPPDAESLAAGAARTAAIEAELDRIFRAAAALEDVAAHRHALDWGDAEAALADRAALVPALEAQHAAARAAVESAAEAVTAAEATWEAATVVFQEAEAQRVAAAAHRDRAAAELATLGGAPTPLEPDSPSPAADAPSAPAPGHPSVSDTPSSDPALGPVSGARPSAYLSKMLQSPAFSDETAALEQAVAAATRRLAALEAESRGLVESVALARERRDLAARRVEELESAAALEERRARPADSAWNELRTAAATAGLLHAILASPLARSLAQRGSLQLAAEASSKRELLLDRLARARGGDELSRLLRGEPSDGNSSRDSDRAEPSELGYLPAWQGCREWLGRRVPAQVATVDDPLQALERLRDHLDLLESRLARQEGDLRGASEDVARGIDVQLRKARGQVRRLNGHLEGVKFGSIQGIRVEMRRVERMEQILRALREGEAQELLFLPSLPIEDALDEIFRRYGGGRSGSQRLLDYREYLELAVEIRRQTGEGWEAASPTRLSTGEAIGVGAALMMVVLTEWERDANLLRARRTPGSLRFLFLDEANRLSRDNLGVLFDLCRNLDLQLLIAAPEVARAEGNTTYRLVRQVTDDGREEVIVSGRRAVAAPPTADDPAGSPEASAEPAPPDPEPEPRPFLALPPIPASPIAAASLPDAEIADAPLPDADPS